MTLKLCENMSQIGPLHHEIHALKVGQFCTPGCTPGVQVANCSRRSYIDLAVTLQYRPWNSLQ